MRKNNGPHRESKEKSTSCKSSQPTPNSIHPFFFFPDLFPSQSAILTRSSHVYFPVHPTHIFKKSSSFPLHSNYLNTSLLFNSPPSLSPQYSIHTCYLSIHPSIRPSLHPHFPKPLPIHLSPSLSTILTRSNHPLSPPLPHPHSPRRPIPTHPPHQLSPRSPPHQLIPLPPFSRNDTRKNETRRWGCAGTRWT